SARRLRERGVDLSVRMGLNRPSGLAQALAGLALLTLLVFTQVNLDVVLAWASSFDTAPVARLMPIGENRAARNYYLQALDVAIPVFLYGLYRVSRLRRQENTQDGAAALAVLMAVITLMVLMREWPYRTFNHRDFERVDFAGARCYVNGVQS